MVYSSKIELTNNFNLKNNISCISQIFNIIESNIDKGVVMRFKKVSNYNEYDALETYIIDLVNKQVDEKEIIEKIMTNFSLSLEDAKIKLATLLSSLQVIQNLYQSSKYKIKNNPGFLTNIYKDKYSGNIIFRIEGVNNFNYLKTLPFYINSLFILAQNLENINIPLTKDKITM